MRPDTRSERAPGGALQAVPVRQRKLNWLATAHGWWKSLLGVRPPRRLRLCESLSLGDRRFVAVLEFESFRFLVGGTAASLALLARLDDKPDARSTFPTLNQTGEEGR